MFAYTFICCNNKQVRLSTGFSESGISCLVKILPAMLFIELNHIIHGYILSSRFLFGDLLHLCSAANLLHKSHESKTQIIYQIFQNHETNACVLVTPTLVQA